VNPRKPRTATPPQKAPPIIEMVLEIAQRKINKLGTCFKDKYL